MNEPRSFAPLEFLRGVFVRGAQAVGSLTGNIAAGDATIDVPTQTTDVSERDNTRLLLIASIAGVAAIILTRK
ncbi:MAG: hypothetical protein AAFQ04_08665 [Pseudomonadota bacterium]